MTQDIQIKGCFSSGAQFRVRTVERRAFQYTFKHDSWPLARWKLLIVSSVQLSHLMGLNRVEQFRIIMDRYPDWLDGWKRNASLLLWTFRSNDSSSSRRRAFFSSLVGGWFHFMRWTSNYLLWQPKEKTRGNSGGNVLFFARLIFRQHDINFPDAM